MVYAVATQAVYIYAVKCGKYRNIAAVYTAGLIAVKVAGRVKGNV